jgi:hypothetical protein
MSHFYNVIVQGIEYRRKIAAIDKIPGADTLNEAQLQLAAKAKAAGDVKVLQDIIYWLNTHPAPRR